MALLISELINRHRQKLNCFVEVPINVLRGGALDVQSSFAKGLGSRLMPGEGPQAVAGATRIVLPDVEAPAVSGLSFLWSLISQSPWR